MDGRPADGPRAPAVPARLDGGRRARRLASRMRLRQGGPVALGFDDVMRRALPAIYFGVGAFYLLLAVLSPFLLAEGAAGPGGGPDDGPGGSDGHRLLVAGWTLTGIAGAAGGLLFLRRPAPPGWANGLAGALGLVTVLDSLALVAVAGPQFVFALTLSIVGFALFLLSMRWTLAVLAVGLGGWLLLAAQAGGGPDWTPRTVNLLAACALAAVAQAMRLALHRRLAEAQRRDAEHARRAHELEREAALGEQRRRILLGTAHKLSTPMTPVLLQAYLLAKADLPPGARRQVEVLRRNLERLEAAIEAALQAAREEGARPGPAADRPGVPAVSEADGAVDVDGVAALPSPPAPSRPPQG